MVLVRNSHKHRDTIYRSTGVLSTGSREFTFPVDSTVESLMVSITLQCLQSIAVIRPSNTEAGAGEPNVDDNRFKSGAILIVNKPEAGTWKVRIAGIGLFFVVAQAKSDIALNRVEFVEPRGRQGHEGYFSVQRPLHMGETHILLVKVDAPPGETKFRLIDSAGETLEPVVMTPVDDNGDKREFSSTFALKHSAFRVAVEGRDEAGYAYQRVLTRLIQVHPPNVEQ